MPRRTDPIRVFEFEKLSIHKDEFGRSITPEQLAKLYDFNDRHGNKYFVGVRDGIRFKNYVGVIQVGGLTIEILPKADRKLSKGTFETESMQWQRALLRMLALTKRVKVDSVTQANLERRHNSLLDLYFELYLNEVEYLLRIGLIKKYIQNEGNLKKLKGRINFSSHTRKNIVHKERFYTVHQIYSHDHLINQILLRALHILKFTVNTQLYDRVIRLSLEFPEMKMVQVNENHFERLKLSRKSKGYEEAIKMAKMIILNYSPDIQGGNESMLALLFDMNKLWEEYIYRMLSRIEKSDWSVSFQNSKAFWEGRTIRPDLVVKGKGSDKVDYVIDTKWKMVNVNEPSDDDLKQMYAYNMYWGNAKSILLYPGKPDKTEKFGTFHLGRDEINECKVGFVDILKEDGSLDLKIGEKIIEKFV